MVIVQGSNYLAVSSAQAKRDYLEETVLGCYGQI